MAIKSQQARLDVSTASATAVTISAITKASTGVVTAGTALSPMNHGLTNGDIVVITGVVGMIEVNNRSFIVANKTNTTFELAGVDTTSYTTYGSGGSLQKQTMIEVGSVQSISGFDGEATEIDVTHLRSTAKEKLMGLQDFGRVTLNVWLVSDTGQAKLRSLKGSGSSGVFDVILSDGRKSTFPAYVQSFSFDTGGPDGAVSGSVSLLVAYEPAYFA